MAELTLQALQEFLDLIQAGERSPADLAEVFQGATEEGIPLPVESSVGEFVWDIDAGTLTVHFTNGASYTYPVGVADIAGLVGAPSAGAFFNRVIRPRG